MIAGLLLFLILPTAMAAIVYLLRSWASLSALLAGGTALVLGIVLIVIPPDRTIQLWGDRQIAMGDPLVFRGRKLLMERADRVVISFLFLTAAAIFALAWRVRPHAMLFPIGLGLLSLLSGALLVRPLLYAALLIEIAAGFSVFALQSEGQPPTRGGLHYLAFTILALPGLLVTHWLMERFALTPDDVRLLNASAALLALSFALLLGSVPFHTWVPAVAGDSEPLASAFVLTLSNGVIWVLLLDFLEVYPDLTSYPRFDALVSGAGLAMAAVGGLLAPSQRRLGRLMGYGALADAGAMLVALGMKSGAGVSLIFLSLLTRPFSLVLLAAGLSGLLARGSGSDHLHALRGLAWKAPWSAATLVLGGLSIAGVPSSAGFVWRWALYRTLAPSSPGSTLLLVLAGVGVLIGLWRALSVLLARPQRPEGEEELQVAPEGWPTAGLMTLAMIACVGMGIFPQFLGTMAIRLARAYTLFTP